MWDKFKKFISKTNAEGWFSCYFLIATIILYFTRDMEVTNNLIMVSSTLILSSVLGGISSIRYENAEIKKLIEEKLTK